MLATDRKSLLTLSASHRSLKQTEKYKHIHLLVSYIRFLHPTSDYRSFQRHSCQPIIWLLQKCLPNQLIIIIIIHTFLCRHKVVTSEAVAAQVRSCHYCPLLWARWNKWVLSIDLKTVSKVLSRTVLGSEFQTAGAERRKARPAKSVLVEGWASRRVGRPKIPRTVSGLQMATEIGWCFGVYRTL